MPTAMPSTQYQFDHVGAAANSGYFWTADVGQRAANTYTPNDPVADHDLSHHLGARRRHARTPELMWVRAFDGSEWSAWDPVQFEHRDVSPLQ